MRQLLTPTFRRNTLLVWLLWAVNSFCYYGLVLSTQEYFESISKGESLRSTLITTCAELPALLLVSYLMTRIARRTLQVATLSLCGVALLSLLVSPFDRQPGALVASFIARGAIAASYAVLYIYTPELYSTSVRGSALG